MRKNNTYWYLHLYSSALRTEKAADYFQAHVPQCFHSLQTAFISRIHDFTVCARSTKELSQHLDDLLAIYEEQNLQITPQKCKLNQAEINLIGQIINTASYKLDPRKLEAIGNITFPTTAYKLANFCIATCRWLIVNHTYRGYENHEAAFRGQIQAYGQTTKRKLTELRNPSSCAMHEAAFKELEETLKSALEIAHVRKSHNISVFTVVLDKLWKEIVPQI